MMISVAELKEALKSQNAKRSMHLPLAIVESQLYGMGEQEKIPTKKAETPYAVMMAANAQHALR